MSEKRITVWVQSFKDRPMLMLQWHDPETGKRKSKSAETDDPGKAEEARADLEYELNNGLHKESSSISWERFREVFEAEYVSGLRGETRDNYRATLDLFEELCSPSRLRTINERTISRFAAAMRTKPTWGRPGMMASSIKVRLQFFHTALQWAADQKMIPAVPKFPSIKVPKKKPQPIAAEAFERLLAKAPDAQMRAFVLAGWMAGLRLNEALVLEWEESKEVPWIDLARNRIILPAEFVKAVEDQWVPLDPVLREALLALPRHGKKVFRFVEARNGRLVGACAVSHRVVELARLAGVRLTMKDLRKGFGCRYAGKVPAQVLQRLMRHANIKTTMDYYANVDDAVEEAILGPQRNSSRNTAPAKTKVPEEADSASSHSESTSD